MPDPQVPLAAELALGLLTGDERSEAERLRSTDSAFAAEVAQWEAVIESWFAELPDQPLTPELWHKVAAQITPLHQTVAAVTAIRPAAAASAPGLWRPLAIAASLLACVFAGLWLARLGGGSPPPAPPAAGRFSIAQISGSGAPHLATVLYDRTAGTLTIRITAIAAAKLSGPARAPEIWLINGSQPPRSLGFGSAGAATHMQASARVQRSLVDGATMAITLEPVSPQPHAAPSSRILGTGTISSI